MSIVRRATPADVATLLPMVRAYWDFEHIAGFDAGRAAPVLSRLLSEPRQGAAWISSRDGVAAGYLLAVYVFSLEHGGLTAEIDEFFVWPEHRGRGVGQELLACAEAEFARSGCTNVSLQVSRDNHDARNFYCSHGYGPRAGFELLDKHIRNN